MISDLPRDLAEKVLSMLPVTSLRPVRSTCKKWNELSRFDGSFTNKPIGEANAAEFHVVMMRNYKVYLFSVNLRCPSIERVGKLISLNDEHRVDISNIFHCDGLLLCVTKDISRLVVWNPCSGPTRWIEPRSSYHRLDTYALGYEMNNDDSLRRHKILRFVDCYDHIVKKQNISEFEIYNFDSNSWKVIDVKPDWDVHYYYHGVSLKGNTYWSAQEKPSTDGPVVIPDIGKILILIRFDFTTERFVPLPLPFHGFEADTVALSTVRETQLAVLFQKRGPAQTVNIWITTKIEPNAVSWSKFLTVDMEPHTGFYVLMKDCSFFVEEKKKVAVVFDRFYLTRDVAAYIIGKKGCFKQADLGKSINRRCWPLVCSYVPSSVQIKQPP